MLVESVHPRLSPEAAGRALREELRPPLGAEQAVIEAEQCLGCGGPYAEAPCTTACPADIDVPEFIEQIRVGEPRAAARTIFAENLMGGSCARTCPVEAMCEGACVLTHEGRPPVRIGQLQRFATDTALAERMPARTVRSGSGHSIAVVGAGPAGLACAGELAALGHRAVVYEARDEPGGLVRFAIAPFRQLDEPLARELRMIEDLGVRVRFGARVSSQEEMLRIESEHDALVLAAGMGRDRDLSLPGDELAGVWDALPFIEALKTGVPPRVGDHVAVLGGGNTAIDVAREALRLGAAEATILYRRTESEMPAYPHELEEALLEGVRFEWLTTPVGFCGEDRVEAVRCSHVSLGPPDENGRRRPVPVEGGEFLFPADTAVKALGQTPRSELAEWLEGVELEGGHVQVDAATGQTGRPGVFAAGDAINGGDTVVEAVREAKLAARAIDSWLGGRT
jgi:glutamate synthase (NADPH/NADH) small chain